MPATGDGKWPPGTVRLLVRERSSHASAPDFVDWAVQALSEGFDTPGLRALAGLDLGETPTTPEAVGRFRTSLGELEIGTLDEPRLIRAYVGEVARSILAGDVTPQAGVAQVHREVLTPFNHPSYVMAWCYLDEGMHPEDYRSLSRHELEGAILEQARRWARETVG